MKRPPYRADHVGSLLRPIELIEARAGHARGELPADALRAIEDEAIRRVVRRQEEAGLEGVTDGEFRRTFSHAVLRGCFPAARALILSKLVAEATSSR